MEQMVGFDAILFPSDNRAPHLVSLMTSLQTGHAKTPPQSSQSSSQTPQTSRMPHPEMYMEYGAEDICFRAWQYHVSNPVRDNYSFQTLISLGSPFLFSLSKP